MEASSKLDDTLETLVHRTRGGAILSIAGASIMLLTLIFTSVRLAVYANEVRAHAAELSSIERRKSAALLTIQELQAQIERNRTVLQAMTVRAEHREQIPPALLAQAQQTLAASTEAVRRAVLTVPTIEIIIAADNQREPAARLREAIIAKGFKVEYVRSIGTKGIAPLTTEVRYFRSPEDAAQAGELRDFLETQFGLSDARTAYVIDPQTPGNSYEIWLSRAALLPQTPPVETTTTTTTTTG